MDNPPEVTGNRTTWEPALSHRLPENPSLELLKRARAGFNLLNYPFDGTLDAVTVVGLGINWRF
jgi:hypothetical protein